jgi:hypothetical protein
MPNGKDTMAQAVYLAQLQACKGKCQCNVCKILRRAADQMTADFLNPKATGIDEVTKAMKVASKLSDEVITFDEEGED